MTKDNFHGYLKDKGFTADNIDLFHNLRVIPTLGDQTGTKTYDYISKKDGQRKVGGPTLVIPLCDINGKFQTLQRIFWHQNRTDKEGNPHPGWDKRLGKDGKKMPVFIRLEGLRISLTKPKPPNYW